MVGREAEAGGIAKHGAKLVTAVACAKVGCVLLSKSDKSRWICFQLHNV